jgi:hypothetical protein
MSIGVIGTVIVLAGVAVAAGPPLTKSAYVAAYNALCDAAGTKAQAALDALGPNHDNVQFVDAMVPIFQHRLNQTVKLVPPESDRKQVKAILAAQQDVVDAVKDKPDSLEGRRGQLPTFGKTLDKIAKRYGLESGNCLSPSVQDVPPPCPGGPCAGEGGGPGPPVPVENSWVVAVCGAQTTALVASKPASDALNTAIQAGDATVAKSAIQDFLGGLSRPTKALLTSAKQAGVPDVANGKDIAHAYVKALKAIIKTLPAVQAQASSLPTTSVDALQTAAKALIAKLDGVVQKVGDKILTLDTDRVINSGLQSCGGVYAPWRTGGGE